MTWPQNAKMHEKIKNLPYNRQGALNSPENCLIAETVAINWLYSSAQLHGPKKKAEHKARPKSNREV